jgi:hypothetical protein
MKCYNTTPNTRNNENNENNGNNKTIQTLRRLLVTVRALPPRLLFDNKRGLQLLLLLLLPPLLLLILLHRDEHPSHIGFKGLTGWILETSTPATEVSRA